MENEENKKKGNESKKEKPESDKMIKVLNTDIYAEYDYIGGMILREIVKEKSIDGGEKEKKNR
jgi:hypothetical protein